MLKKDLYEVLGIDRGAEEKEIKRAYRKLAKKYHPDTNQGNKEAEKRFKEVTEAYDILSDPEKKKLYDRFGMAAFDGSMGQEQANENAYGFDWSDIGRNGGYSQTHYYTSGGGGNMDDIFKEFFGGLHGDFREHRAEERDLRAEISLSFEEAALGCDKRIQLGDHNIQTLEVHVPAGIDEGQSIRLKGKGKPGSNGKAGDLLLKVHIQEHPVYERKGLDVYTTAYIPYTTAVLGGRAVMKTLYGDVECRVPAGTQCGSKIRLKNKGIVSMKDRQVRGDEYVIIQIAVPKHISDEERSAVIKLADAESPHRKSA